MIEGREKRIAGACPWLREREGVQSTNERQRVGAQRADAVMRDRVQNRGAESGSFRRCLMIVTFLSDMDILVIS